MLRATDELGVPVAKSGIVLPLAVAIFRVTGPPMNLAVAIYVAHLYGVHLGPAQIAAGIAVAAVTTMGAVGLTGALLPEAVAGRFHLPPGVTNLKKIGRAHV